MYMRHSGVTEILAGQLGTWLREVAKPQEGGIIGYAELYQRWIGRTGAAGMNRRAFGMALSQAIENIARDDILPVRRSSGMAVLGLALRETVETVTK